MEVKGGRPEGGGGRGDAERDLGDWTGRRRPGLSVNLACKSGPSYSRTQAGWRIGAAAARDQPASQPARQWAAPCRTALELVLSGRGTARRERESARRPSVHPLREAYTFPRRDTPEAHGAICSEALRSAQCVSRQWTKAVVLWRTSPVSVCMGGTADRRDDMRHWSPRWSPLEPTGDGWWGCSARSSMQSRCHWPLPARGCSGRHREAQRSRHGPHPRGPPRVHPRFQVARARQAVSGMDGCVRYFQVCGHSACNVQMTGC